VHYRGRVTGDGGDEPEEASGPISPIPDESVRRIMAKHGLSEDEIAAALTVMRAVTGWRDAEQRVSEASQRYMQLSELDMRALRFVIVMRDQGRIVTARDIAEHLGISSASTTKLLDRLEAAGHIERGTHPEDRRALAITVNDATRRAAELTIGREHARRFHVAASLTPAERRAVLGFLDAMSRTIETGWDVAP